MSAALIIRRKSYKHGRMLNTGIETIYTQGVTFSVTGCHCLQAVLVALNSHAKHFDADEGMSIDSLQKEDILTSRVSHRRSLIGTNVQPSAVTPLKVTPLSSNTFSKAQTVLDQASRTSVNTERRWGMYVGSEKNWTHPA